MAKQFASITPGNKYFTSIMYNHLLLSRDEQIKKQHYSTYYIYYQMLNAG